MTYCSTYVGDLDDPDFDPNGFDYGNIPRHIGPSFPPTGQHYNGPFHDWVKIRQIPIKETDHTAYVATVTKAQIEDYIAFAYGPAPDRGGSARQLSEIEAVLATLQANKLYALVAECD